MEPTTFWLQKEWRAGAVRPLIVSSKTAAQAVALNATFSGPQQQPWQANRNWSSAGPRPPLAGVFATLGYYNQEDLFAKLIGESMATKWYCKLKNKTVGPMRSSELIKMIRDGKVTPTTLVRKNDSQWVAAKAVTGLLQKAGVDIGEHRCPYCGSPVTEPPTSCSRCKRQISR